MDLKIFMVATMGVAMSTSVAIAQSTSVTEHENGVKVYTNGMANRTNLEVKKSATKNGGIVVSANGYNDYTDLELYAKNLTFYGNRNTILFDVTSTNKIGIGTTADDIFDVNIGGSSLVVGNLRVSNNAGDKYFDIKSSDLGMSIESYAISSKMGDMPGTLDLTARQLNFNAYSLFSNSMTVEGKITCHDEIEVTKVTADNMDVNELKAKDVKVELNNAADYVFEENYNLQSLQEVERYVKENKHLPGVPSAAEIAKNGMSVSEMSNLFLEKIEELTLHMIQLQKENEALKAKVASMEK